MFDLASFSNRRRQLTQIMGSGVAIIATAPEHLRNRDTHYAYRYDSYFHYLTAFPEPEAVLVLHAGTQPKSVLFCRSKNEEREIWDGFRYGPTAAAPVFGFDEAYPIEELDQRLPDLLANQDQLYCMIGRDAAWDQRVAGWLNAVRARTRAGDTAPHTLVDLAGPLDDMRLIKDAGEVAIMRKAAQISAQAHQRAMRATRPGLHEYAVEAELLHEFRRQGSPYPAYTPIVAGGSNACVLHYVDNNAELRDGDLLLIDAGCELDGYASDITRTFPVNGRFSGPQRAIYELVLAAQAAAIAQVQTGAQWDDPHQAAVRVLVQGLLDLKLLQGSLDGQLESGDYKRFYMHRTGHWLGRDVHDAGEYKRQGEWRKLEPGMVLTVEPGCYIRPGADIAEDFWNIGVRIEDDVLVTHGEPDVLSIDAVKRVVDIEQWMAG